MTNSMFCRWPAYRLDSAIEHVTAATQENSAGIAEIDKMVARIHTLAKQLQDGLAM